MKIQSKVRVLLLLAASSLLAATSYGEDMVLKPDIKFWLESRFDLINSNANSIGQATGQNSATVSEQDFQCNRVRPNAGGKITDHISYRVRMNFCNNAYNSTTPATGLNRDHTNLQMDMAFVDDKIFDGFNLRVGKWAQAQQVAWESEYLASNVFTYSTAFTTMNNTYGYFRTGAEASYTWMGQIFKLNATTATNNLTDASGSFTTNYGLSYGAIYKGTFLDDMIQPIVSYTIFQNDGNAAAATPTVSTQDTLIAAGVRLTAPFVPNLMVDLDYDNLNQPFSQANNQGNPAVTTTYHARVFYKVNSQFIPFVNGFAENFATSPAQNQFTNKVIEGGLWYYPYENANFRYELVYSTATRNNDPNNSVSSVTTNKWFVGVQFDLADPLAAKGKNDVTVGPDHNAI